MTGAGDRDLRRAARRLLTAREASCPMAGRTLAELGAAVDKVEPPRGDLWRRTSPSHASSTGATAPMPAGSRMPSKAGPGEARPERKVPR